MDAPGNLFARRALVSTKRYYSSVAQRNVQPGTFAALELNTAIRLLMNGDLPMSEHVDVLIPPCRSVLAHVVNNTEWVLLYTFTEHTLNLEGLVDRSWLGE